MVFYLSCTGIPHRRERTRKPMALRENQSALSSSSFLFAGLFPLNLVNLQSKKMWALIKQGLMEHAEDFLYCIPFRTLVPICKSLGKSRRLRTNVMPPSADWHDSDSDSSQN
jgi:hypothetical protein